MKVKVEQLKAGMKLKQPVYSNDNLIAEKGISLNDKIIKRFKNFEIRYVDIDTGKKELKIDDDLKQTLDEERELRNTFIKEYEQNLEKSKELMDKITKGERVQDELNAVVQNSIENISVDKDIFFGLLGSKDSVDYLFKHSLNSTAVSIAIGDELEYSQDQILMLGKSALLHDIGMSKIDKNILEKKKVTNVEKKEIEKHTTIGFEILKNFDEKISRVALMHHERIDGSGYPKRESVIPEIVEIIAVADVYSALIEDRSYRPKISNYQAVKTIMSQGGKKFSTKVVKAFLQSISIYPVNSEVRLSNGQIGKVVRVGENPFRPVIDLKDKEKYERVDLSEENNFRIYVKEVIE